MTPIKEALADLEFQGSDAQFSYRKVAEKFGAEPTTLARRHQGKTCSRADAAQQRRLITTQQEEELVSYIKQLTERGLPPTRSMIAKFVSVLAKWAPSESWITRFLSRNSDALASKYTTGIDRNRFQADSEHRYKLYFDLLYSKMQQYNVDARHIYNMDEKGFLIGITSRSKRVFSRRLWEQGKVTQAVQDGNRGWITILPCICADGSAVEPAVIYEGKGALHDVWVRDVTAGKHQVFLRYK